jgi:pSer/pThr/pTyr-binding forkhead associated (FHA) protein
MSASQEHRSRQRTVRLTPALHPDATACVQSPGILTIGREKGDVRIPDDPFLSQTHARVELRGESCILRDCGSTNGTFIEVMTAIELRPGDEIIIGGQLFRVAL